MWNASRFCVSSLRRGHANLLCIVPILVYVLPKQVHQGEQKIVTSYDFQSISWCWNGVYQRQKGYFAWYGWKTRLSKSRSGFLGLKMLKLQISASSLKYFVHKSAQNNETRVWDCWKCSRNQWVIVEIISVVQATPNLCAKSHIHM